VNGQVALDFYDILLKDSQIY